MSADDGSSASTNSRTCGSGSAPRNCDTGCPFWYANTAGMLSIPCSCDTIGFSSVFSFVSCTCPANSSASDSSSGPRMRQGPHHGAQNSTITGASCDRATTSRSKLASVTSTTATGLTAATSS